MTAAMSQRVVPVLQPRGWAQAGRLYALIDACDTPEVPGRARGLGASRAVSLYEGRADETLFGIAPYLFHVDETLYDWIAADLWSTPWGFFALADATLDDLKRHFRRFLVVESPEGESWYFRFYDPRVLVKFLGGSTEAEVRDFFGPIRAYAVTDPESYGVNVLTSGPSAAASSISTTGSVTVVRR